MEGPFTPEEIEFQNQLLSTPLAQPDVHTALQLIEELVDAFIRLKEIYQYVADRRVNLLVQLQLLQAKHNELTERCFADPDALARFFFLHERMSFLYETLSQAPTSPPEEPQAAPEIEEEESDHSSEESGSAWECPVCCNDYPNHKCRRVLEQCGHQYCEECLRHYLESRILGGDDLSSFPCLDPSCHAELSDADIKQVLEGELLAKFERFSLLQYLRQDPNAHWCTFADCDTVVTTEPGDTMFRCPTCFRSSCIACKTAAHSGMSCSENQANCQPEDPRITRWKRKHDVKCCPHCRTPTIRVSGCPDMICSTCHLHWSWDRVGHNEKETRIEFFGFYYPRLMKEVLGSRDTLEDWNNDKKEVALRLVPWTIGVSIVGIPLLCVAGPPALLARKFRRGKSKSATAV